MDTQVRKGSGYVVEYLTGDQGFAGSSLTSSHWIVSLCKTHQSLLSSGSTQENRSQHNWKIVDRDVKNQIEQTKMDTQVPLGHSWQSFQEVLNHEN